MKKLPKIDDLDLQNWVYDYSYKIPILRPMEYWELCKSGVLE